MKKSKLALLFLLFFVSSCSNNQTPESSEKHSTLTSIESIEEISEDTTIEASEVVESNLLSESVELSYIQPENYYYFSELFSSYYDHFVDCEFNDLFLIGRQKKLTIATYDFYLKDGVNATIISYDSDKFSLNAIESDGKIIGYSFTFSCKGKNQKVTFASNGYAYEFEFIIYEVETDKFVISFDFYNGGVRGIYVYFEFGEGYDYKFGPGDFYFNGKRFQNIIPGEVYELTYYGEIYSDCYYPATIEVHPYGINVELVSKAKVIEATLSNGELVIEGYTNLENIFTYVYDENGNFVDFNDLEDETKLYVLKIDDDSSLVINGIFTYNPYENNN